MVLIRSFHYASNRSHTSEMTLYICLSIHAPFNQLIEELLDPTVPTVHARVPNKS